MTQKEYSKRKREKDINFKITESPKLLESIKKIIENIRSIDIKNQKVRNEVNETIKIVEANLSYKKDGLLKVINDIVEKEGAFFTIDSSNISS